MLKPQNITTMILSVTVETNRKKPTDIGTRLINAEFWHGAKTVETTKTQFFYPLNYRDRREKPTLLKTTDAIATIRAAANLAPVVPVAGTPSEAITLPVHPDNDVTKATVNTDFRTRDIVWGYNLPSDPTNKSEIFILSGGFFVYKYTVDNTIAEVVALVTV